MFKRYICMNVNSGRIYISSQTIFHELVFPSPTLVSATSSTSVSSFVTPSSEFWLASLLPMFVETSPTSSVEPYSSTPDIPSSSSLFNPTFIELPSSISNPDTPTSSLTPADVSFVPTKLVSTTASTNVHPMVTRSKNGIFEPKALTVQTDFTTIEPSSYFVASKHPH